jgi:hypothetical protein
MSETQKSKSKWAIFQSSLTVLTPVLIGVLGLIFSSNQSNLQNQISQIDRKISNVKAMEPFMEMIADKDITTSKLGAYAIYMLKKDDDVEMAAQMILAPGKRHLLEVLIDISDRDAVVKKVVNNTLKNVNITSEKDSTKLSEIQKYALEIINSIDMETANESVSQPQDNISDTKPPAKKEWLYLGNFKGSNKSDWVIKEKPSMNTIYALVKDANVRINKPQPPNYALPRFVRVANKGDAIKIDTFTVDKKGHYWARVIFQ